MPSARTAARYAFETYNPEGMAVIRGGIAEIAP